MKINLFKTRRGKLKNKLESLLKDKINQEEILKILNFVDEYETDNLNTIEKLRKSKTITLNKIHGGLKQAINAHGPITKVLIGSAGKRIYGSLLEAKKDETLIEKIKKWIQK